MRDQQRAAMWTLQTIRGLSLKGTTGTNHDAFQVALRKFPFLSLAHLAEFQQDRHNKNDGLL